MKKGKITMLIIIGLVCTVLTAVLFIQFRTIDQIDIGALERMRESDLTLGISVLETRYEEVLVRTEEVNNLISEYRRMVAAGYEASELLERELRRSNDLVRKKCCHR